MLYSSLFYISNVFFSGRYEVGFVGGYSSGLDYSGWFDCFDYQRLDIVWWNGECVESLREWPQKQSMEVLVSPCQHSLRFCFNMLYRPTNLM